MDALKRAGPRLSIPHDDDEHADSTLLLCARGDGEEEAASFKELTTSHVHLSSAHKLPLTSAQFTNISVWILGFLMLVVKDFERSLNSNILSVV